MKKPWVFVVVGGALAVVLALAIVALIPRGDTSPTASTPTATRTPSPTATPTPIPAITPEPAPTRPSLDELVLTENSLGTLALATDPGTYDPATSLVELTTWDCEGSDESGTAWTPVLTGGAGDLGTPYQASVAKDGAVTHITISDPQIRTDRGARPGMSWLEIGALYPEAADTSASGNGAVHAFETGSGSMYFYSWDSTVGVIGITTHTPATDFVYTNNHGFYAFCL